MVLGSSSYQSQPSMWEASYYSRLRIKNSTDNTALNFTFWKGTLKISITELATQGDGKVNELAYIHLSPTKARILSDGVNRIINSTKSSEIFGVDTGAGEIRGFIAIGRENNNPFLFIAKVNANGKYESSKKFYFNIDYNYLLSVQSIDTLKVQKEYINTIELQQLYDILIDYARFASGAAGASFYDIGRYEAAKSVNMIKKIAEKNGIESKMYDSSSKSNNSFFNNTQDHTSNMYTSKSRYSTIDDLESELN